MTSAHGGDRRRQHGDQTALQAGGTSARPSARFGAGLLVGKGAYGWVLEPYAEGLPMTASRRSRGDKIKTGGLQDAIVNSANFSIATNEKGVIQMPNVDGAERMVEYTASEQLHRSRRIEDIYEFDDRSTERRPIPEMTITTSRPLFRSPSRR